MDKMWDSPTFFYSSIFDKIDSERLASARKKLEGLGKLGESLVDTRFGSFSLDLLNFMNEGKPVKTYSAKEFARIRENPAIPEVKKMPTLFSRMAKLEERHGDWNQKDWYP